ncbi:aminotransferase class I/II-fold pyridoxal phosphate-dependent enzyme [Streptomyces albus]|uniref:aminotransferase class I/II-fold pyridoxal phosphate-dependent enzyme n=1 Tax=Streptomyces albus TaxID=1888 RepID=UPI0024E0D569|nr:aminotransferase class I/II-fold pyridoxal phosphate-dependent enzyme [Streptomyces albus]
MGGEHRQLLRRFRRAGRRPGRPARGVAPQGPADAHGRGPAAQRERGHRYVHGGVRRQPWTPSAVSFAKALGAPFGSVLAGPADLIEQAATYRLWYGGGLHQSGFMAAAALHALENNVDRLAEDHMHARLLRDLLVEHPGFTAPEPETNMVLADISGTGLHAAEFAKAAAEAGVQVARWTDTRVRLVTRLGVEENTVREAVRRLHRVAERRGALTAG